MDAGPSCTSSSERPGWGLAGAVVLLMLLKAALPGRDLGLVQGEDAAEPYEIGAVDPRADLLVIGDSRVGPLDFGVLAGGLGGSPTGRVWTVGGGSIPDMIALLEARDIRPKVLVLGASPLSMGLWHFRIAYRSGTDPDLSRTHRLKRWIRIHTMRPLSFLPDDMGPAVLSRNLERLLPFREAVIEKSRQAADIVLSNLPGYRRLFSEEPAPSTKTVRATVEAIRRFRNAGTKVVLVRLPVDAAMLELEDGWGAAGMLEGIARETDSPLIDMNRLETWPRYRDAAADSSHVTGEEACRRLSEEVGRRVRKLLDPDPVNPGT